MGNFIESYKPDHTLMDEFLYLWDQLKTELKEAEPDVDDATVERVMFQHVVKGIIEDGKLP